MRNTLYIFTTLLALAACTNSDELLNTDDHSVNLQMPHTEEGIVVCGGGAPTRALPNIDAEASADRMWLRVYRAEVNDLDLGNRDYKNYVFSSSELKYETQDAALLADHPNEIEIDAVKTNDPTRRNGRYWYMWNNRTRINHVVLDYYHDTKNAFGVLGVAYKNGDRSKFAITPATDGLSLSDTKLWLTDDASEVPELYFGRPYFTTMHNEVDKENQEEDIFYLVNPKSHEGEWLDGAIMGGYMLRIVSQINLNVTDIPVKFSGQTVEELQLWGYNIGREIGLWGHHGTNVLNIPIDPDKPEGAKLEAYRIEAAKSNQLKDSMQLAHISMANNQGGATAHLSSFLLPSDAPYELKLKVKYRSDAGTEITKTYTINPSVSATLTGDNARYKVATSGDSRYKSNGEIYIYRLDTNKWFSYSNIRVNVNGRFDLIATESATADVTIEVEPGFIQTHTFEAK